MRINPVIPVFAVVIALASCSSNRLDIDVDSINADLTIKRFEQALFSIPEDKFVEQFSNLYDEYQIFMNGPNDTMQVLQMLHYTTDPNARNLFNESQKFYEDFSVFEEEIEKYLQALPLLLP